MLTAASAGRPVHTTRSAGKRRQSEATASAEKAIPRVPTVRANGAWNHEAHRSLYRRYPNLADQRRRDRGASIGEPIHGSALLRALGDQRGRQHLVASRQPPI